MTKTRATTIIGYGGSKPEGVSNARWNAIVSHINREVFGK